MRHPPTCLVEVHRLPGPQKRGTGATLIVVGIEPRDRGHPPADELFVSTRLLEKVGYICMFVLQ